ncbi:CRISPR-associated helicase Cas3' [Kitasatospora sp. NPDC049258]|uniref:CRISPR-associated helicase Cas3' n=1 Tax=Kitasatospora sp. NPDC049258 TaxID=3155394 RepID=UPI00344160EA
MTENDRSTTESGGLALDARLWGKSRGLSREYPVVCHLLDTAAVVGVLWDDLVGPVMRRRVAQEMGLPEDACRRVICLWAGLHDIGKITASFQAQVPEAFAGVAADPAYVGSAQGLRHEVATHWALPGLLAAWGYPQDELVRYSTSHQVAQLLGGHHGCFGQALQQRELADPVGYQPGLGAGGWHAQRVVHAEAVRRLTGAVDVPEGVLSAGAAVVVAGLVVVADWLASQEETIEARLPLPGWSGTEGELAVHWGGAVAMAPELVRGAGLGRASFPVKSFAEQFPFPANPLQADLAERLPGLVLGPGLLLVTAPTGDGKTEAALHAASVVARAAGAGGVYFALPTMATADAMFGRVRRFAEANVTGERALTLLHSMAWLSPAYEEVAGGESRVLSDGATSTEAGRWLRTGRRGLLAPLSAGTIDQALTGVLPVRYNVLRLLGLSGKVLVVDEAHAYGPWMHSLLVRLLEWLGALRSPVVLLSATLTGVAASSLVEAYRRGAGFRDPVTVEPCYPGWLWVDAVSGRVSVARKVGTARPRTLVAQTRRVRWDVRDDPASAPVVGGRRESLRRLLAPVVERGGCVVVCCTTVDEAQRTFLDLQAALPELAEVEGGLRLLHSRFPAWRRQEISEACEVQYGKPAAGVAATVRPGSVLVATQIVEQSLDLDFDLVVSDLAPLAQLLQRAGRGKRHARVGGRPVWAGADDEVRLVVLEPRGSEGGVEAPGSWGSVYDASLLARTGGLLDRRAGAGIAVPGDVQGLVDEVYSADFGDGLKSAAERDLLAGLDAYRIAGETAEKQLAALVAVPAPRDVSDLSRLSSVDLGVTEELLTTRLGADSGRAVCVFVQADGRRCLDAAGTVLLPVGGVPSKEHVALVVRHTVPLPGRWLVSRGEEHQVPVSWRSRPVLEELVLLPVRLGADGRWTCRLGEREIEISSIGISVK